MCSSVSHLTEVMIDFTDQNMFSVKELFQLAKEASEIIFEAVQIFEALLAGL